MELRQDASKFIPDDPVSVIAACKRNNAQAQYALIKIFYGFVKGIAMRYSSDDQDADEISNDSFLKVFTNLNKYNDNQPFKAWLRTIVVNTAIDYFRKNKQRPIHTVYEEIDKQSVIELNEEIISRISADEILSLVRQLSPAYQMVFSLYVIDGYSHKEIAAKLGIKEGTSKSNLQDARLKLQNMIKKLYPKLFSAYELKSLPRNED